jgi:ribosomal protein S18 acetylase RimI-like enzyme
MLAPSRENPFEPRPSDQEDLPMESLTVRPLAPDEWESYRAVRLAALTDAPTAFSSTLARELSLTEEQWRHRLANRGQFVASVDATGQAVGLAGGVRSSDGQAAELVTMWVDPGVRGRGAGRLLVGAVVGWAVEQDFPEVRLWVAEGNHAAERLYTRCGFSRTGTREPIAADDPARMQLEMVRRPQKESFERPGIGHVEGRWA